MFHGFASRFQNPDYLTWRSCYLMACLLNVSNYFCRRPHKQDGADQTIIRRIWEFCHKFLGRSALILAQINISLGMFLAVVPTAVFAVWFGYLGVWVFLFIFMENWKRRRECGKGVKPAISSGNYEMNPKL